jgi:hypothetical protein
MFAAAPFADQGQVPPLRLPAPRGPLSEWVLDRVRGGGRATPAVSVGDPFDDDLQLALYCAYEPHFSDLPEVVGDVEWDLELLRFRSQLESAFERGLRDRVGPLPMSGRVADDVAAIIESDRAPSLSRYMEAAGTLDQMREFVVHRSAFQLKEADAHTLGVPRLHGAAKQLLASIQAGEYGVDAPDREMHSSLYALTMRELGLDDRLHAYLDVLPGTALAISNVTSMFGLHRRWRGALVGHLAVFEMTSVVSTGRYSRALARLGTTAAARRFYDVHVLADAEHEVMASGLTELYAAHEPNGHADVLFGARCALVAEERFGGALLARWDVIPGPGLRARARNPH